MSAAKHTPGPLVHETRGFPSVDVRAASGRAVARTWGVCSRQPKDGAALARRTEEDRANARRIVACWNACLGISTEELEDAARATIDAAKGAADPQPLHPVAMTKTDLARIWRKVNGGNRWPSEVDAFIDAVLAATKEDA